MDGALGSQCHPGVCPHLCCPSCSAAGPTTPFAVNTVALKPSHPSAGVHTSSLDHAPVSVASNTIVMTPWSQPQPGWWLWLRTHLSERKRQRAKGPAHAPLHQGFQMLTTSRGIRPATWGPKLARTPQYYGDAHYAPPTSPELPGRGRKDESDGN